MLNGCGARAAARLEPLALFSTWVGEDDRHAYAAAESFCIKFLTRPLGGMTGLLCLENSLKSPLFVDFLRLNRALLQRKSTLLGVVFADSREDVVNSK